MELSKEQLEPVAAWKALRRYTNARIALGRVGASLLTKDVLDFRLAHARARDAVHIPLNTAALEQQLQDAGYRTICVRSRVTDRAQYLQRPDLGRQLDPGSRERLHCDPVPARLTVVVADGLSSLASSRHALPLLNELRARLTGWELDPVVIAVEARVALGDEIGELRGAEAVVVLLGERPGLSSPDSLGAYMTYAPRHGRSDAERNCVSNIRIDGLSYEEAAYRIAYLLNQARLQGCSGITVKDVSVWTPMAIE